MRELWETNASGRRKAFLHKSLILLTCLAGFLELRGRRLPFVHQPFVKQVNKLWELDSFKTPCGTAVKPLQNFT